MGLESWEGRSGRCLPFVFLLLKGDGDFATWGGAMTDADEDEGDVRSDGIVRVRLNPGRGCGEERLQEAPETALQNYLREVVECVIDNVKVKHLPSAALLFNLAMRLSRNEAVPEEAYLSFAAELWKSAKEMGLDAELEIANPEGQATGGMS